MDIFELPEIVNYISQYLSGKDIINYGLTSKTILESLTYYNRINQEKWKEMGIIECLNNLEAVKYLVSQGADPKARNNLSIIWASQNGYLEVVKYLVSQGADPKALNNEAIILASECGYLKIVQYLIEQGIGSKDQNLPIIWASNNGHLEILRYLVSQGADSQAIDNITITQTIKKQSYGNCEIC